MAPEALLASLCIFVEDNLRYKFLHVIPTLITCMQMPGGSYVVVSELGGTLLGFLITRESDYFGVLFWRPLFS